MKEFCAFTTNLAYVELENGKLCPLVEMIFIVSEPVYSFDAVNDVVKSRAVADCRFSAHPSTLRKLAENFIKIADETEQATKRINDNLPPLSTGGD